MVAFFGISLLIFVASAMLTAVWSASMSAMGGMPMPGGWTMSMAWMRMPGETWHGAATSFMGMWIVMMVAMMLPSVVAPLWRYHQAVGARETNPGTLTALVGLGYFFVWAMIGAAVYPFGVALAYFEMQQPALARAAPIAAGVIVLTAGAFQFTSWKLRHLACCRKTRMHARTLPWNASAALRNGLRLGTHCSYCCSGLMAVLLSVGLMDIRWMSLIATAICLERLAPGGERFGRATGALVMGTGALMIAHQVHV